SSHGGRSTEPGEPAPLGTVTERRRLIKARVPTLPRHGASGARTTADGGDGMAATYTVVGQSVRRAEGEDKVTGRQRYTADVLLPGTLWGKALRSTLPHARIVRIDASAALALPGVHAV